MDMGLTRIYALSRVVKQPGGSSSKTPLQASLIGVYLLDPVATGAALSKAITMSHH
jgi:hypothetical protein